ncbi:MAG: HD-GYP domain-containing protein [Rubrivivax sp.]|nr:HD-GYP domain-containing protein [Rubrivivax sp.]
MLKKVPILELRLGMHLHKLEGAWLQHPFWTTRFVIDSSADLRRLHACGLSECWIDTALGLDVAVAAQTIAGPALAARPAPAKVQPPSPAGDRPLNAELTQAAAICSRGRKAVKAMFNEARMGRTVDAEQCLPLVEEIAGSVQRNPGALVSLARLKTRDDYSYMHSVAVCGLMVALARQSGLDDSRCREAGLAGLMHDIGKVLMPLEVLNKPGGLTDSEFDIMRTHPQQGHDLLKDGQGVAPSTLDVVLHHHERIDGSGYPHRLAGDGISLLARMGAICDVYDAVTSDRPYKDGWDPAQSIASMASWKGHFDTALFAGFVQSLGIYPTGSLVRLASGRLAVVAEQNPAKLVSPVVMVFYSIKSQLPLTPLRLDLARPGTQDRIVAREENSGGRFSQLEALWADPEVLRRLRA